MEVKKYIASNMKEAIQQIKDDLGPKAIIVTTRKIRKGKNTFGLFGKDVLEVTAAKNEEAAASYTPKKVNLSPPPQPTQTEYEREILYNSPTTPNYSSVKKYDHIHSDINELKDLVLDMKRGHRKDTNDQATISHMRYEMAELKNMMNSLITQNSGIKEDNMHENVIAIFQQLIFNGVEKKFAKRLVEEVQNKIAPDEINNFSYVKLFIARMFMQVLKIDNDPVGMEGKSDGPKVITLLGTTGVGKTTTIAKIASVEKIKDPSKKIALLTVDTFRIAAIQQLQEYGKIIKVPVRVISDHAQLENALKEFHDFDMVLIDTSGRSQRDEYQMKELRDFLKNHPDFKNLLVLSSTTKDADLVEITKRFGTIDLSGVIFTKLDESSTFGTLFNHAIRFKIPFCYLTTGQNVPDDIEIASRERLIDLLLNISGDYDEQAHE